MVTGTGKFPIGFRRSRAPWQQADLRALAEWGRDSGFESLDLGWATKADVETVRQAGLAVGSVDLLEWNKILSDDSAARSELRDRNTRYIRDMAGMGIKIFLAVLIPADPARDRAENYRLAVEGFAPLVEAIASAGGVLALEGWPGTWPYYANLGCNPETCRALIRDLGLSVGINYDPSHLIRLGIDPIRFLNEFAPSVYHVHAKDTRLLPEAHYELGAGQASISTRPHSYGEHAWRYTIPGNGAMNWPEAFAVLGRHGYLGRVSVELEDDDFCGAEDRERLGLRQSLEFLERT